MARAELRLILVGLAATGLLGGCVSGTGADGGTEATAGTSAPARVAAKGGEVEAPDVFQTTDSALWDGRPSLGGIWVASPEVTDPERVVMFNPATGKSINGALFRRERENPGPTLQLSSDAAEALGILAGQPTEIRVTALRKVEVEAPAEVAEAEAADPATAPTAEGATVDPAAAETAALATAALDAADGTTAVVDGAVDGAVVDPAAPVEPPKKKTWKERRAEAKAKREAEKAAKAAAAAGIAPVEGEAVTSAPVDPAASAVAAIETAPLDATAPVEAAASPAPVEAAAVEAAPAAPEKKKTRRQIKAEAEAAAAAAAAAASEPAAPVAAGRPIQIASFSKEENAKRAVEALAKIGIPAQPQQSERSGKAVWGVVAMGDAELLKKIKAAGFADAYFLQ